MLIRPTAFTIGLIIHFSIALFFVYTEFGIDLALPIYKALYLQCGAQQEAQNDDEQKELQPEP